MILPSDPELSRFVQSYARDPSPDRAFDRLLALDLDRFEQQARQLPRQWPVGRQILMAFYAGVIHENPDRVLPFARRVTAETTGNTAAFCTEALARGASQHRMEALAMVADRFALTPSERGTLEGLESYSYARMRAVDANTLDMLWASYFATGKTSFVEEIAQALEYAQPSEVGLARIRELSRLNPKIGTPEHEEYLGLFTAYAAVFGLKANAAVDPRVREVLLDWRRGPIRLAASPLRF